MNKLIHWFAGTLTAVVIFCGESMSPIQLLCTAIFAAALLWLSTIISDEYKAHKYRVPNAPIASQVARDLRIEVQA